MDTVNRAIILLKKLADKPMSVQQIADELNIHKSSASRLVKTLERHHFVVRNQGLIKPGYGILNLAYKIQDNLDIRKIAEDYMEMLRQKTEGTIHLAVLDNTEIVYIDKKDSPLPVRMYSQIGKRSPVYCTGVGKAILAFKGEREKKLIIDQLELKRYTENTITSKTELLDELDTIRSQRFAIDNKEHENEIICIAAPIFNFEQKVVASLSIAFTTTQSSLDDLYAHKQLLLNTTSEISKKMGF